MNTMWNTTSAFAHPSSSPLLQQTRSGLVLRETELAPPRYESLIVSQVIIRDGGLVKSRLHYQESYCRRCPPRDARTAAGNTRRMR